MLKEALEPQRRFLDMIHRFFTMKAMKSMKIFTTDLTDADLVF